MLQPEHPALGHLEHRPRAGPAGVPARAGGGAAAQGPASAVELGPGRGKVRDAGGPGILCDGVGGRVEEGVHGLLTLQAIGLLWKVRC